MAYQSLNRALAESALRGKALNCHGQIPKAQGSTEAREGPISFKARGQP